MVQTREHNARKHIGYIMFQDLGNKDYTSMPQAETHAYCVENKHPDTYTKHKDKSRTVRYRLHEPKTDKRDISCRTIH
eukprot:11546081-Heterocapsa_arctica.AAC.1